MHILDEPLLERVRQHGQVSENDLHVIQEHLQVAADIGADGVLVTCSTLSPAVDKLGSHLTIPVFRIDDRLVNEAINLGHHIGVVATAESTLVPTRERLKSRAEIIGKPIELEMVLVEGAFNALQKKDFDAHDRFVWQSVERLATRVDVIVLAQASMARILETNPTFPVNIPLLTSPYLALAQVKDYFASKGLLQ